MGRSSKEQKVLGIDDIIISNYKRKYHKYTVIFVEKKMQKILTFFSVFDNVVGINLTS